MLVTAGWRLALAIWAVVAHGLIRKGPYAANTLIHRGWPSNPLTFLVDAGVRMDGFWYGGIALHGYTFSTHALSSIAYFPLFPLLIKGLSLVTGSVYVAGMVIPTVCMFLSVLALQSWLDDRGMGGASVTAVGLMLCFPFGFFWASMYTESTFLFLALSAFVFFERGRWQFAGLCAFLAVLSRPTGLIIAPCLTAMILARSDASWAVSVRSAAGRSVDWIRRGLGDLGPADLLGQPAIGAIRGGAPYARVKPTGGATTDVETATESPGGLRKLPPWGPERRSPDSPGASMRTQPRDLWTRGTGQMAVQGVRPSASQSLQRRRFDDQAIPPDSTPAMFRARRAHPPSVSEPLPPDPLDQWADAETSVDPTAQTLPPSRSRSPGRSAYHGPETDVDDLDGLAGNPWAEAAVDWQPPVIPAHVLVTESHSFRRDNPTHFVGSQDAPPNDAGVLRAARRRDDKTTDGSEIVGVVMRDDSRIAATLARSSTTLHLPRGIKAWIPVAAGPVAYACFAIYQWVAFGTPLATVKAVAVPPFRRGFSQAISDLMLRHPGFPPWYLLSLLVIGAVFLAAVPSVYRRFGLPYATYSALVVLFPMSTGLVSLERYVLVDFPAFAALACVKRRVIPVALSIAGFYALLGFMAMFIAGYTLI
jgi:hypothetical protein